MSYTPGPWKVAYNSEVHAEMGRIATIDSCLHYREEIKGNATLMSMAPELLEALKTVRQDRLVPYSELYKYVDSVIRKSQGC
jgi:hypothetical protein